jgi:hypothetical protein
LVEINFVILPPRQCWLISYSQRDTTADRSIGGGLPSGLEAESVVRTECGG